MTAAFLYHDSFGAFDYGSGHPLKPHRLRLTYELIRACGLLTGPGVSRVEARPAEEEEILLFHGHAYLEVLKSLNSGEHNLQAERYGMGYGDNPVFVGMYDWSRLVTGASLESAKLVDNGEADIAFNISGGLHHALASSASGFCYINDPVVTIMWLLKKGRRVMYVDIDAHHGDGVQAAFYETDRVLTVSIHETGYDLFPGSGFERETGRGAGEGYAVNIPLPTESDDELFLSAFHAIVPPLYERFKPDVLVSQLGVDTFRTDPLAHLNYTTNGFCAAVGTMKNFASKWVALGGGGYDIANVARAWTLAWGIMTDQPVPEGIPEEFLWAHRHEGFEGGKIRDEEFVVKGRKKEAMTRELDRLVASIRATVFPKVRGG